MAIDNLTTAFYSMLRDAVLVTMMASLSGLGSRDAFFLLPGSPVKYE